MTLLAEGAATLGIDLSQAQLLLFETYYRELVHWNKRANLTNITGYAEVQQKHFLDSLTTKVAVEGFAPNCRVLDVGAGAGFPGVPLKLAFPEIDLVLIDSVGKKTQFLQHLIKELEIPDAAVLQGRAEKLAHREDLRESCDLVTARGVARMPVLLEYCLPFCRTGGVVATMKHGTPVLKAELASAANAMDMLGGRVADVYQVRLPGLTDNRVVVVIEKIAPTPVQYPRRPGIPAKRAL